MMKRSVYLDTTIPSYYFDKRESLQYPCEITRKWWNEERQNFNIFISPETIAELSRGDYPEKGKILEFVSQLEPLEPWPEINQEVKKMYTNELLEEKYKAQRELSRQAEVEQKDYLKLIEEEVQKLFKKNGWELKYSKRKGGFLGQTLSP
jgi:hypothetical protein